VLDAGSMATCAYHSEPAERVKKVGITADLRLAHLHERIGSKVQFKPYKR